MNMVQFSCSQCEGAIVAELIHIGRAGRCPHCNQSVIVPFLKFRSHRTAESGQDQMRSSGVGSIVLGPIGDQNYPEDVQLVSGLDIERRNHIRFVVPNAKVSYERDGRTHGPFPVENLSRGGLAFRQPTDAPALEIDQDLVLALTVPVYPNPVSVVGKVVRIDQGDGEGVTVHVGIQLTDLSDLDAKRIRGLEKTAVSGGDSPSA